MEELINEEVRMFVEEVTDDNDDDDGSDDNDDNILMRIVSEVTITR